MSKKGIWNQSSLHRIPKAVESEKVTSGNRTVNVTSVKPAHQLQKHHGRMAYQTTSFQGVPSNLLSNTSRYVGQIQQGSIGKIHSATIKIRVRLNIASGGVANTTINASPFWFERIEIKAQNGSSLITKMYGDTIYWNLNIIEQSKSHVLKRQMLFNDYWQSSLNTYTDGSEVTVYIPLVGSVFGMSDIYFENAKGDLNFEFYPQPNAIFPTASQADCSFTVLDLQLLTGSEILHPKDVIEHKRHFSSTVSRFDFLEPIESHHYNVNLTAGQETRLDLDAITGKVSHFYVVVRDSSNPDKTQTTTLGNDTKIDVESSSGTSLFGNGTPVDLEYLNGEVFSAHYNSDFMELPSANPNNVNFDFANKGRFIVPFTNNVTNSHQGVCDGYLSLKGERMYLTITPSSTYNQGSQDIYIYAYVYRSFTNFDGRFKAVDIEG